MKKIVMIVGLVLLMLVLGTGMVAAQKTMVLETVPPGQITGATDFALIYDAIGVDDGAPMLCQTYSIYMLYNSGSATNFAISSAGGLGFMMDTSALIAPSGVQASAMNFGSISIADGAVLATFHSDTPTQMIWDIDNALFNVDVDGVGTSGRILADGGQLLPGEDTENPGYGETVPAPPIPELITIVLVALGLCAIGGYVWYRRHNMAAVPA